MDGETRAECAAGLQLNEAARHGAVRGRGLCRELIDMRHGHVLAVVVILAGTMAVARAASAAQGSDGAGRKDVVTAADYVYRPNPSDYYPDQSRELGEVGLVKTRACYDVKGKVEDVEVSESSGFELLDEAAVRYSRDVLIKPGTLNGIPEASCVVLPVRFAQEGRTSPAVMDQVDRREREATGKSRPAELTSMPSIRSIYPSESKKLGEEGTAVIVICYDTKGKILSSKLYSSSGFERLDEAAVGAGKKMRLNPPVTDGVPREGCSPIPLEFTRKR